MFTFELFHHSRGNLSTLFILQYYGILSFPEEERRGRVTLFPISLTSLERAPPLAPPCPIIPVNHVDKEGTITLDQILDSSGERNSSRILSSMQSSRVGKRRSTGLDAVETPKLRINTSFQTLRSLEGNRAESRSAIPVAIALIVERSNFHFEYK